MCGGMVVLRPTEIPYNEVDGYENIEAGASDDACHIAEMGLIVATVESLEDDGEADQ